MELINEESASGHPLKRVQKWLKVNGYNEVSHNGKHPKFEHITTKYVITGVNLHAKDNTSGVRGIMTALKAHHKERNLTYIPLDSKIDNMKVA